MEHEFYCEGIMRGSVCGLTSRLTADILGLPTEAALHAIRVDEGSVGGVVYGDIMRIVNTSAYDDTSIYLEVDNIPEWASIQVINITSVRAPFNAHCSSLGTKRRYELVTRKSGTTNFAKDDVGYFMVGIIGAKLPLATPPTFKLGIDNMDGGDEDENE